MKILVVEDEPKVAAFIKEGLEENGFTTAIAYDGLTGERMFFEGDYQLVILDIVIPHLNGLDLCRKLKEASPLIPVIMLTALGTTEDKLSGFDAGADDYLGKPFEFKELLARIRALMKRSGATENSGGNLRIADLELDIKKKVAIRGGTEIILTAKEFMLLEYFMNNPGKVLSRPEIAEKVWDVTFDFDTNVVDVYVNFLRNKIDRNYEVKLIHTRIGFGYVFGEM